MTVAIKGMDIPKSCMKCKFTNSLHEIHYCLFNREPITDYGWQKKRPDFCPLTELPEENKDMSWEELKTTYKNKIDTFYLAGGIERITINGKCLKNFKFYSDGTIADEHFNIISERNEISTICKVIKALIGDER